MDSNTILTLAQKEWGAQNFQDRWEIQDWWYYDYIGYPAAGTNSQTYFSVPAGQNDPVLATVKKNEQTNLLQPSQIGGTDVFIWTGIRTDILLWPKSRQTATTAATSDFSARQLIYARWLGNMSLQGVAFINIQNKLWMINNKPWLQFPAGFGLGTVIPPAVGGTTAVNGGANAFKQVSNYDQWGLGDTFSFGQPVFLAPNTNFNIRVDYQLQNSPAATNMFGDSANQSGTILTGFILQGFKVRPRQ